MVNPANYTPYSGQCIKLSPKSRTLLDIYVYPNPYFIQKIIPRNTVGKWVHTYNNLLNKNLWSNVWKSSTAPLQQAFLALVPEHCRHPKVRHLQVVAIIQEQVFRLDISTKKFEIARLFYDTGCQIRDVYLGSPNSGSKMNTKSTKAGKKIKGFMPINFTKM